MLKHKSQTECYLNKKELPKDQRIPVCFSCKRQKTSTFTLRASAWLLKETTSFYRPHPHQDKVFLYFLFTELGNLPLDTEKLCHIFRKMECQGLTS